MASFKKQVSSLQNNYWFIVMNYLSPTGRRFSNYLYGFIRK